MRKTAAPTLLSLARFLKFKPTYYFSTPIKSGSILNSQLATRLGFTLLELLITFSIISIISGLGFISFSSYSRKQVINQATNDIQQAVDSARFNALSNVKICPAGTYLSSYEFRFCVNSNCAGLNPALPTAPIDGKTYLVRAICGNQNINVMRKDLPQNVTFSATPNVCQTLNFTPINPTVSGVPCDINVSGYSNNTVVAVDPRGFVYTTNQASQGVPTATPTSAPPTPTPTTIPLSNLALSKPVVVSSTDGNQGVNAVDGNLSTRWSSGYSDAQYIYVDLGASHSISEIILKWETARGKSYQIQTSNDASSWTTIYSTTATCPVFGGNTTDAIPVVGTGRYVRMLGVTRCTWFGYSLWEFQIYGT